ncbi:MAG TPA: DnaB-like helicase C-terminal domain-containing protein [Candidatus Acidoferrum sp.]|nr:DnaB-like helicase C-terminal domain-containing protein [Candidatus Acidoferrum sp.]
MKELPSTERSVLRALCLTINVAGSTAKDKILDTLTKDHFALPINRALFTALRELHHRGEYVVLSNLEDELHTLKAEIPGDLSLEDLFRGEAPKPAEVKDWVDQLTGKGKPSTPRVGEQPTAKAGVSQALSNPTARVEETPVSVRGDSLTKIKPPVETKEVAETEKRSKAKAGRGEMPEGKARPSAAGVLSSEAEEWTSYLQEVAARQGKILETGFAGLDEPAGGLSPGLMVVVDQDSNRLSGFLKQLTDQIAIRSKAPCLYLSFGLPKSVLRIRTLSRLSGVPSKDIEKGRIKKGSPEWDGVEQNGRKAAEWLKWVFIVQGDPEMEFGQVRDMGRQLLESKGATTCLVVVDSLDKMGKRGESPHSVVAGLKEVSESLDVLVIASTTNKALLSEPGVDFLATLGEARGAVQFEVIRAEDSRPTIVRFDYRPDIHRFTEQPAS